MPPHSEKKWFGGRPIGKLPAALLNSFTDAAKAAKAGRFGAGAAGPPAHTIDPANTIIVQNLAADFDVLWQVLELGDPILTPEDQGQNVAERIGFEGDAPASGGGTGGFGPIAILQTPCDLNDYATAVVSGVTPCYVLMHDPDHEWANPVAGVSGYLESAAEGGVARILWHGEGGDPPAEPEEVEFAIVHLIGAGGSGGGGFFARLEGAADADGHWNYTPLTLDAGGLWVNDGSATTTYKAVPSAFGVWVGMGYAHPVAGLIVWVWPSKQAGFYEFMPLGLATAGVSGLMSYTTQSFTGRKEFRDHASVPSPHVVIDPGNALIEVSTSDADGGGGPGTLTYGTGGFDLYADGNGSPTLYVVDTAGQPRWFWYTHSDAFGLNRGLAIFSNSEVGGFTTGVWVAANAGFAIYNPGDNSFQFGLTDSYTVNLSGGGTATLNFVGGILVNTTWSGTIPPPPEPPPQSDPPPVPPANPPLPPPPTLSCTPEPAGGSSVCGTISNVVGLTLAEGLAATWASSGAATWTIDVYDIGCAPTPGVASLTLSSDGTTYGLAPVSFALASYTLVSVSCPPNPWVVVMDVIVNPSVGSTCGTGGGSFRLTFRGPGGCA